MKKNKQNPLVDIIIPVYNTKAHLLEDSLNSALSQTYTNIVIIVIDDGSTKKETLNTLEKYKKNIKLYHQNNQGVSSARNNGLSKSQGDYVFFLDSDDTINQEYIERLVDVSISKKANVVFSGKTNPKTGVIDSPIVDSWIDLKSDLDMIALKNQAFTASAVLIEGNIARANRFDTNLAMGEDTVYILGAMKNNTCFFEGKGGYQYNKHQNNSSSCKSKSAMMKYLDDSLTMASILKEEYGASENTINVFRNKKITTIFSNGLRHKDLKNAVCCIEYSEIYRTRKRIKNCSILKEKNLSLKNKVMQLIVNNRGVDILCFLNRSKESQ